MLTKPISILKCIIQQLVNKLGPNQLISGTLNKKISSSDGFCGWRQNAHFAGPETWFFLDLRG